MAKIPYGTNGRYLSEDLADDSLPSASGRKRKRSTTPKQEMHGPKVTDRPRLSTPDPQTPGLPSSVVTAGLTTDGSSVASAHTATSALTIPDEKDEDDGIVRGVVVMDPFARTSDFCGQVVEDFDDSAFFATAPETGRADACELMESVEVSYIQTVPSQEDGERDEPVAKRRRIDSSEKVSTVEIRDNFADVTAQDAGHETVNKDGEGTDTDSWDDAEEDAAVEEGQNADLENSACSDDNDDTADDGEDPDNETNSNWDHLEVVQERLAEYNDLKKSVKGYEKWTKDQAKLHKLLALRGCWPMFEHSWALNFSIRNIFPTVFAPTGTRKSVAITSKTNEFRTTRALEAIFDLSPLVHSYRQSGIEEKIGGVLKKALKRYINWAVYDAGVEDRVYVPTLEVYEFDPRRWAAKARASKETIVKKEPTSEWDSDGEELNSDPISDEVEKRLRRLAARHREDLVTPESRHLPEYMWTYKEQPPLLFAFVVLQHMVMVVSMDPSLPDNEIIVFSELDMSLADQWLWNALAIALPVHMARDALWERRNRLPVVERMEVEDPDL
ncbi:hypothetical protein CONLIGDRAFT_678264 [Coniochaeta ligniaria NRRL 30616]|uniref:Uncharacterized protein n=1 Tax=Coniochaeta ligniaria NRRL 30616 TaxID=1408157 RepID=A0A1J7IWW5_9PEZI|nr:hypothetical protein CONLIGDRAFT_678264 [Coniochaeta ligniaria NRRL 30616]